LVVVPDFFQGNPLPLGTFPLDTEEKKKTMASFSARMMDMGAHALRLNQVVDDLTEKKGITAWGSFGLCFGGMLTALTSAEGTKFKASGTAHPGRPDVKNAKAIVIPYICLFSKDDGEPETIKEYGEILKSKPGCVVDHYANMHHGWMAARANLKDEENVKEFEKG
jgi:dienelactone hydrolase